MEPLSPVTRAILEERFGGDALFALATTAGDTPSVRTVNAHYENGALYIITDARSRKMQELARNPKAAVCGEWFTAQGVGENLGHLGSPAHRALARRLREAFASWYGNGHVNEADPNTCILRITLHRGVLFSHGTRYELDFTKGED